jgi:uncharacterized membrane protein YsdA (DUF1294 family)
VLTLGAWVFVMSTVTWIAFARDKRAAERGEWRVTERTLLTLAALGGTPGAFLARRMLRHKTAKQPFNLILTALAAGQVALLAVAGSSRLLPLP